MYILGIGGRNVVVVGPIFKHPNPKLIGAIIAQRIVATLITY